MRILGISAFHRDSAAALVVDGKVLAVAKEEHFTRLARDSAFPTRAVRFVLGEGGVHGPDLDLVVFYEKPLKKFERVLVGNLRGFPRSSWSFAKAMFVWLGDRLWIKHRIATDLGIDPAKILFADHLESIASCALRTSPFEEAAVLVVDDAGEWSTTYLGRADADGLEALAEVQFPHSLGLLAAAVTQFLGFTPGEDEDKVEALAAWGEPRFAGDLGAWIEDRDGLFALRADVLSVEHEARQLWGEPFEALFGAPRYAGEPLQLEGDDRRYADVAASLQAVLEEQTLKLARELHRRAGTADLCFAGALAANRRLVARLAADGPFERIHVPVAPGKAGGALGAALLAEPALDGHARLAPEPLVGETIEALAEPGARALENDEDGTREVVRHVLDGRRVAWVSGGVEFGLTSLQNRIVLSAPGEPDATRRLLEAVQHVEPFLPCRLALAADEAERWVELPVGVDGGVRHAQLRLRARDALRAAAPSAVLPDGRVWVHVVDPRWHPRLAAALEGLAAAGRERLLLTSDFRMRGSPVVRNESEAVDAWRRSTLDALVVECRAYDRSPLGKPDVALASRGAAPTNGAVH